MQADGTRQAFKGLVVGSVEIQRDDGGFAVSGGFDFIVHGFELGDVAAMQDHGGTVRGIGQRGFASQTLACAGDENNAVLVTGGGAW